MCDLCDPLPLSPVHTNVWLSLSRGKNNMAGNMRLNHSCDFEFDINESAWFFSFFKYNFQTCLHLHLKKKRNNNKKVVFLEKFEYFHRPGPGVAILAVCRRFGNKTPLCPAQICILTGTLVPSLLWHFLHLFFSISILFLVKIQHSFQKNGECLYFTAETQALLWIAQEFSAKTTQSTNTETDTTAARGSKTYTYATKTPELGIFQTGKQLNRKTCLEVEIFIIIFLYAEHLCIKICTKKIV